MGKMESNMKKIYIYMGK